MARSSHHPSFLMYAGGSPAYRKKCDEVAPEGYAGSALA